MLWQTPDLEGISETGAGARPSATCRLLERYAGKGWPILGLEPSCLLTFRDDYVDLVDDAAVSLVAKNVYLLDEFMHALAGRDELGIKFTETRRDILFHAHCHQKALVGTEATVAVLNLPPNYRPLREIPSGCCGMAGSFGYEKEHYELSMKVGRERLFDVIDSADADTVIAASGTSCRHQIADATGRQARHWAEIMAEAL